MSPTASKIEASIENIDGHELSPDSKPGPIKSDQEYEPGWRTWLDRDNFAFLILGILVPLPIMTVQSASGLMFPGITGINGIVLAIPAALASLTLPMVGSRIPYNITVIINTLLGMLALLCCTLGTDIVGPLVGTGIAGITSALGQYVYLAAAASFDQRVVITFSIGTRLTFAIREGLYIALMAGLHQNWKSTLRIVMIFPCIQIGIWWLMLSKTRLQDADRTRTLLNQPAYDSDTALSNKSEPSISSAEQPESFSNNNPNFSTPSEEAPKSHFGPGCSKVGFLWRTILPKYTLPLTLSVVGAMITSTGLATTYISLNSFKVAPKGDLNYQIQLLAFGFGEIIFALISLLRALPYLWTFAILQSIVVGIGIAQLFYPFLTYFPIWLIFIFLIGGFEGAAVTNTNYKIAEDCRRKGKPEVVRAFAMSYSALGNFSGDAIGGGIAIAIEKLSDRYLHVRGRG